MVPKYTNEVCSTHRKYCWVAATLAKNVPFCDHDFCKVSNMILSCSLDEGCPPPNRTLCPLSRSDKNRKRTQSHFFGHHEDLSAPWQAYDVCRQLQVLTPGVPLKCPWGSTHSFDVHNTLFPPCLPVCVGWSVCVCVGCSVCVFVCVPGCPAAFTSFC